MNNHCGSVRRHVNRGASNHSKQLLYGKTNVKLAAESNHDHHSYDGSNDYVEKYDEDDDKNMTTIHVDSLRASKIRETPVSVVAPSERSEQLDGNKAINSIGCVTAKSGNSFILVSLIKEGKLFEVKLQEMKPGIFDIGLNNNECNLMLDEQEKLVNNLRRQESGPLEAWIDKFRDKWTKEEEPMLERATRNKSSNERKQIILKRRLTYMCMGENIATCWRVLLNQVDRRSKLLALASCFYNAAEDLKNALNQSEAQLNIARSLISSNNLKQVDRIGKVRQELDRLTVLIEGSLLLTARKAQKDLIAYIKEAANDQVKTDSRDSSSLLEEARVLINYIANYLDPIERRKIQFDRNSCNTLIGLDQLEKRDKQRVALQTSQNKQHYEMQHQYINKASLDQKPIQKAYNQQNPQPVPMKQLDPVDPLNKDTKVPLLRQINNFDDLTLVEQWLSSKLQQLNSQQLSSLGLNQTDSRQVLARHEQIMLECQTIEEAASRFQGKSLHSIRPGDQVESGQNAKILDRQRTLLNMIKDVLSIVEVRIVLLKRTIDFYLRSTEATNHILKLLRRLQVDNSLQSVHFVANELELRDVSSVVASGATILSELQQLQLAQQQGQRPSSVHLMLFTNSVRNLIDQLNQELAHLKSVLSQRKLVLQNEDSEKMANNFIAKCKQLELFLEIKLGSFLSANARISGELNQIDQFCLENERIRAVLQTKSSEVEALLRSMASLSGGHDKERSLGVQTAADELRQRWIEASNCLNGRIDFAKKYASILNTSKLIQRDIESLDSKTVPENNSNQQQEKLSSISRALDSRLNDLDKEVDSLDSHWKKDGKLLNGGAVVSVQKLNGDNVVQHSRAVLERLRRFGRDVESRASQRVSSVNNSTTIKTDQKNLANNDPSPMVTRAPRFIEELRDQVVEPMGQVELECELDQPNCRFEWLMNQYKRIPPNVQHSITTDPSGRCHKLIISNFSPLCCASYSARATNEAGRSAVSTCQLKLATPVAQQQDKNTATRNPIERIIRGVDDIELASEQLINDSNMDRDNGSATPKGQPITNQICDRTISTTTTTVNQINTTMKDKTNLYVSKNNQQQTIVARHYSGPPSINRQVDSPRSLESRSSLASRSITKSPGTDSLRQQVAPNFVEQLRSDSQFSNTSNYSKAGIVCVVVGNPPPTIEWLHNKQVIASAKCLPMAVDGAKNDASTICKLTIETSNPDTSGQYVCRATNKFGESSSQFIVRPNQ